MPIHRLLENSAFQPEEIAMAALARKRKAPAKPIERPITVLTRRTITRAGLAATELTTVIRIRTVALWKLIQRKSKNSPVTGQLRPPTIYLWYLTFLVPRGRTVPSMRIQCLTERWGSKAFHWILRLFAIPVPLFDSGFGHPTAALKDRSAWTARSSRQAAPRQRRGPASEPEHRSPLSNWRRRPPYPVKSDEKMTDLVYWGGKTSAATF